MNFIKEPLLPGKIIRIVSFIPVINWFSLLYIGILNGHVVSIVCGLGYGLITFIFESAAPFFWIVGVIHYLIIYSVIKNRINNPIHVKTLDTKQSNAEIKVSKNDFFKINNSTSKQSANKQIELAYEFQKTARTSDETSANMNAVSPTLEPIKKVCFPLVLTETHEKTSKEQTELLSPKYQEEKKRNLELFIRTISLFHNVKKQHEEGLSAANNTSNQTKSVNSFNYEQSNINTENVTATHHLYYNHADPVALSEIIKEAEKGIKSDSNKRESRTKKSSQPIDSMGFYTIEPTTTTALSRGDTQYRSEVLKHNNKSRKHNEPYATFARMRKIGRTLSGYGYYGDSAEIFYKQAEFMKNFTDNYGEQKPLQIYYATYSDMDDEQLRTYFTWRTGVKQGNIEDTYLSYAYCYIFELINNIGVRDEKDGLNKLINFWYGFRTHNNKIDGYMSRWIKDYYIMHHSKQSDSFEALTKRYPIQYTINDVFINELKNGKWDIHFVEKHSKHKITKMSFYKKGNTKLIEECLSTALQALNNLFKAHNLDFTDLFMFLSQNQYYRPFGGAVYMPQKTGNKIVKISEHEVYICKGGQWSVQEYTFWNYPITKGYILKKIEIHMRKALGGSQNLKTQSISEIRHEFTGHYNSLKNTKGQKKQVYELIKSPEFEKTIILAIQEYCRVANIVKKDDGSVVEIKPVEIDMSKLDKIKEEHEKTAERLILEEKNADDVEETHEETLISISVTSDNTDLVNVLTENEIELIKTLVEGGQVSANCEILIESINEKALAIIEDNIIFYEDGKPYIYDEYLDELISPIGGTL